VDTGVPRHWIPPFGPYLALPDADAVASAQHGDRRAAECLLYKYRNLVRTAVQAFYIPGTEREDLLQIGMIGLWQAIVDFRRERSPSFPAFARVCIRRHLLTAIKSASRLKQAPLNCSMPIEASGLLTADPIPSSAATSLLCPDPETVILQRERVIGLQRTLRTVLSDFEWSVLAGFRHGLSYNEIASRLGCKVKSVDNALARIRRKVSASVATSDGTVVVHPRLHAWH
jgi:RNA polymerase sporulation-specific sigma factor